MGSPSQLGNFKLMGFRRLDKPHEEGTLHKWLAFCYVIYNRRNIEGNVREHRLYLHASVGNACDILLKNSFLVGLNPYVQNILTHSKMISSQAHVIIQFN